MTFFRTATATAVVLALSATAAMAHPKLVSSTPAADSTVAATAKLELHFSETLMPKLTGADISSSMMAMGGKMESHVMKMEGKSALDPKDKKTLIVTLSAPLPAGTYKVDWHAVSTDTHRLTGNYSFTVK